MYAIALSPSDYELELHRELASFVRRRLTPVCDLDRWREEIDDDRTLRLLEGEILDRERAAIAARAAEAPADPDGFVAWFEGLKETGPGQNDPLFPWIAEHANHAAMVWFMTQEVAGEAGVDDLVALAQVRLPTRAKLELARNYWDEMGQGHESGMHGPMLQRLARELRVDAATPIVWEALALANILAGLALNRRFGFHIVGALGAIELTSPWRAEHVNAGLRRLGIDGAARRYFALHATLDVKHSASWNREVLRTLVAENPRSARAMAEGALMRLEAGRRCFVRYRAHLGV